MCYLWQSDVLWTTVISDVFTALAYYSFTAAFIVFIKNRKDLAYPWFFILAGSVIFLACGTAHLISAIVIWEPIYGILAVVKAATAISSVVAGIAIWYVLPFFVSLPSPSLLQQAIDESVEKGEQLEKLNQTLEHKVISRTGDLANSNKELNNKITEYAQIQSELRRLKNYMQNIVDSMPSVLIGLDADLIVTQWNKMAEKVSGLDAGQALDKSISAVYPFLPIDEKHLKAAIENQQQYVKSNCHREQSGQSIYEDITVYPLVSNSVQGAVIRVDDVTSQFRGQEMMVQSEKMLSVGGLAAGMAHEINNPLAGMVQTANVMKTRLTDKTVTANITAAESVGTTMDIIHDYMEDRGILRMLGAITESGKRIADIVDNMLSFARKSEGASSTHDIRQLLDKTIELSATDYDSRKHYNFKDIKISKEYQSDLPEVPCEGAKIQQVLMNILRNGAEAMQEANTSEPSFIIRAYSQIYDAMLTIEIEDNGPGMGDETQKRVFEPFFTTKAVGVGTGLGLSVSYFIITENHNGKMRVESEIGKGTKFIIQLPLNGKASKTKENLDS